MTAHVDAVKAAAAQAVANNHRMNATIYGIALDVFYAIYERPYIPAQDRNELERIKWHVRRILNGDTGPGRGGKRDGAGRPKVSE